jgi:hypothetical protein
MSLHYPGQYDNDYVNDMDTRRATSVVNEFRTGKCMTVGRDLEYGNSFQKSTSSARQLALVVSVTIYLEMELLAEAYC